MNGSIRKRVTANGDTRWTALWRQLDPVTGEDRQRGATFATRKEAQQHLRRVLGDADQGLVEPSTTPLAAFLTTDWLPAQRDQLRPASWVRYEQVVRVHIESRPIGNLQLRNVSAGSVAAWMRELADANLAVSTRRNALAVLSAALAYAEAHDLIRRNPASRVKAPKEDDTRVQAWTDGELRRWLAHVESADARLFALWRLLASTGMRRGEALGLTWEHVDVENARLRVEQQLRPAPADASFDDRIGPPKSKRSRRTVALDERTVDALRAHRDTQLVERAVAGDAYEDHDLVFANELGQPLRPQTVTDAFARLRKAANVPVGTLHVLRHTSITIALTNGVPLHVVAARAGDRPEQILSTYAHLLPTSDEQAAATIAAAIA